MSFTAVRTLLRERMETLGFEEHDQPFQPNQIGETIVDGSFHLETGSISGSAASQRVHSFDFPTILRVYKRGYVDLLTAYDDIHGVLDTVLTDLLDPAVRIGTDVKDLVPDSIDIVPISESNDNVIYLEIVLTARLELCFGT